MYQLISYLSLHPHSLQESDYCSFISFHSDYLIHTTFFVFLLLSFFSFTSAFHSVDIHFVKEQKVSLTRVLDSLRDTILLFRSPTSKSILHIFYIFQNMFSFQSGWIQSQSLLKWTIQKEKVFKRFKHEIRSPRKDEE